MNHHLKLLIFILLIVGIFYFVQNKFNLLEITSIPNLGSITQEEVKGDENTNVVFYNTNGQNIQLNVEIAKTTEERKIGLSGREVLGDYNGMLFIMDEEAIVGFWMKDMLMSIDMIFVNSSGFIVDIYDSVVPCASDYCPNIFAREAFKYVIEAKSGFCKENNISIGNSVNIKDN